MLGVAGGYVLLAMLTPFIVLGLLAIVIYSVYKQKYTVTISLDVGMVLNAALFYAILFMFMEILKYIAYVG